ncbi:ABC transporter permease subunit [Dermabacteraceae bacterium P13115]|nr:ABC transporter permease subunit [Dermabacteraceae bacterium TAE3-ERU5]
MSAQQQSAQRERSTTLTGILVKVILLGTVLASALYILPVLFALKLWTWVAIVIATTVAIFVLYSTKRFIPGKYLFPGTALLVIFLISPILLTVTYSFTNFGDGSRGTKEQAITAITGNSVQQAADSPRYNLTVATKGSTEAGPFVFYLVDPKTEQLFRGEVGEKLEPITASTVKVENNRIVEVDKGEKILTPREVNSIYQTLQNDASVEVNENTAIRPLGTNQAFAGTKSLVYDKDTDSIKNLTNGEVYTVGKIDGQEYFVKADGSRAFAQSWLQNVGFDNYKRLFTNSAIGGQFLKAFAWTLVFAFGSVFLTFVLGLFLALVLNDERIKGRRLYRSFLLLPYAVPGFIALLVWSSFYNRDFGLINQVTHLNINWLGDPTWAKVAVLLTNLWMGFPYMFIVCTGALQSIPNDVREAARIDGASRFQTTVKVITPLLLVSVAPLLVASFAFNFNNFNAIKLLTDGGPFPPGEYVRGGTDILISMIYRIAFGGSGQDFGFAAAVSVALFVLTGVLAAMQFRLTKTLEDVN